MPSDRIPISELGLGSVNQVFLLSSAQICQTKSGSDYLRCTLADKTGELSAVRWNTSHVPELGLYFVSGALEEYQGKLSLKIHGDLVPAKDDLSRYIRCSDMSGLNSLLDSEIERVGGEYGDVVRFVFGDKDIRDRFFEFPAATQNHHAYMKGLAEHTLSMVRLARTIAAHYQGLYGDDCLDLDLLIAGTLLHDLGKIYELEPDGFTYSRKARGELVGHIAEMVAIIHDACMATLASQDTRDRLLHMVLSHHGRMEWGSPVEPRLAEAMILHQVDMIDSRFAMFREVREKLAEGEVSERIWSLGGRVVR